MSRKSLSSGGLPYGKSDFGRLFSFIIFPTIAEDKIIQQPVELELKGKILDKRHKRPVIPKQTRGGTMYIPRYAVAKYARLLVVNGHNGKSMSPKAPNVSPNAAKAPNARKVSFSRKSESRSKRAEKGYSGPEKSGLVSRSRKK